MKLPEYKTFGYDGPKWVAYFYFQKFSHLQLGIHLGLDKPNAEIHVPFGFFRIGRRP